MRPLPSPQPNNSPDPRQAPSNWAAIYQPFSNLLRVPTHPARDSMRPSKSHVSLKDLPDGMESLYLDRTANSTPAAKHKKDVSLGRSTVLTPPIDKHTDSNNLREASKQDHGYDNDGGIYLESKAEDDVFSRESQSHSGKAASPLFAGTEVVEYATKNTLAPRPDRLLDPITPSNAQGVLPPAAAIFVANLSVNRTNNQLEQSCHEAFDSFGRCVVIIGHDKHKHPYAVIQYYTVEDAARALHEGRELVIDGRSVRIERSRCQCSVVLSRISGGAITEEEARELLGKYGPIEQMNPTTHADARFYGMPEGIWVKFAYYLDCKDCIKAFNNTTSLFKVYVPPERGPRTHAIVPGGSPIARRDLGTPRSPTDQKSIFVGNLPEGTTEAELLEIFDGFGQIKGCNVIRKPIAGGQGFNIFGFIEFATANEADGAADADVYIQGKKIRVEQKFYSTRQNNRLQLYNQPASGERSPRGIAWGPSANAYQSPGTPMPYGFQPIYLHATPGGFAAYPSTYGWTSTPPSSGQRQRAPNTEDFFIGASPSPQFLQMHPGGFGMTHYPEIVPDDQQKLPRRYR